MSIIARQYRAVLLSVALAVAVSLCLPGCGDDNGAGSGGGNNTVWNNNCTSGGTCKSKQMPDDKTWMTENLNIATADSWCYNNSPDSCAKYGRLYTWDAATTACPGGWHLPSREEWRALAIAAGGTGTYGNGGDAGKALKSASGWKSYLDNYNGTNNYGFSALPGGGRRYSAGAEYNFEGTGYFGHWWTATQYGNDLAWTWEMGYDRMNVSEYDASKNSKYSVRCIADAGSTPPITPPGGGSDTGGGNNNGGTQCDAVAPTIALVGANPVNINTVEVQEFRKWMRFGGGPWADLIMWTKGAGGTTEPVPEEPCLIRGTGDCIAFSEREKNMVPEHGNYIIKYTVRKPECRGVVPSAVAQRVLIIERYVAPDTGRPVTATYPVTVISDGTGATPSGNNYAVGATVSVTAGTPPSGYRFQKWTSTVPTVTFSPSANNAAVTFVMPNSTVTVTAVFELVPVVPPPDGDGDYEFVMIGGVKWMKKNLNIETEDSWCYGEGGQEDIGWDDENEETIYRTLSSSEIQANCNRYGRLYKRSTAKTVCPTGWHLPSNTEWKSLVDYAGGNANKLKARSGWNDYNGQSGNGMDDYGFSALPGGYMLIITSTFFNVGKWGTWWTATDGSKDHREMSYSYDFVQEDGAGDGFALSVRCVAD